MAASTASAIGRSKWLPSLSRSAGARLISTRLRRQRQAHGGQRGAHPLARLADRLVGQADDQEGGHAGGDLHLHLDRHGLDAGEGEGLHAGDGHYGIYTTEGALSGMNWLSMQRHNSVTLRARPSPGGGRRRAISPCIADAVCPRPIPRPRAVPVDPLPPGPRPDDGRPGRPAPTTARVRPSAGRHRETSRTYRRPTR